MVTQESAGLLGALKTSVSSTTNDTEVKIAQDIVNEYTTEILNAIDNDFVNINEMKNNIEINLKNSTAENVSIS